MFEFASDPFTFSFGPLEFNVTTATLEGKEQVMLIEESVLTNRYIFVKCCFFSKNNFKFIHLGAMVSDELF